MTLITPRVILFTGKGGVGKTTTAAGTAVLAARRGLRTLAFSTDAAHSLADAIGTGGAAAQPTEVAPSLWVQQVDTQGRFERSWAEIQGYLRTVLAAAGVDPITAEELTVLPGADEVMALLELRDHVRSGAYDVVIVDCAPTGETLRLLALPEALGWYMDRLFGVQRRMVQVLRPVLNRAAGVPMPSDAVFGAIERLHADLQEVRSLLTSPAAGVRLVLTPERVVLAEARRSWTTLSLYGYRVDGVVANRVFPGDEPDAWRAGWVRAQRDVLEQVRESFGGLPLWSATYQATEPMGIDRLAEMAGTAYASGEVDPLDTGSGEGPLTLGRTASGPVLRLALPFAGRADVDLARHADDLVITVGSHRRVLTLPVSLAHHEVAGATVADGALAVRFRPSEPSRPAEEVR